MARNDDRAATQVSGPPEPKLHGGSPAGDGMPPSTGLGPPAVEDSYEELERKYRHRTYQAQELMVEKLLRGHFIDMRALERKLHMFDLHFQHEAYLLVLVCPAGGEAAFSSYDSDIRDGGQVGLIVSSIFSELLGERADCYPANLEDRYAFLLNFTPDETMPAQTAEICRDAVKFIRENFDLELKVCVSGVCDGLSALHEAFHQTERVAVDAGTTFREGVCVKDETEPPPNGKRMEPTIEKLYLNALVTQDFQMAMQLTLDRIREICNGSDPNGLERAVMFLNMRMQTTGSVLAIPMGELMGDRAGRGQHLDGCTSLEELEQAVQQFFGRLDSHYNTAPSDYSGTTGKVIHLISKKYMEPDLSVEMICDCLGKSRSYLSRMFKENTGMNLLDYLHTTRLTEAKKLLNETDLGISEIASRVGYYSGWTLARVFKRYEGITPTAYRKAFCGMQDT